MIKKRGKKFVVTTESGDKTLGSHATKEQAQDQLAAIEISKKNRVKRKK